MRLEADWTKFEYSQYGHSRNSKKSHMIYHCLTAVWNGQETLEIHTHLLMRKTWLSLLHIRHKISARLFGKKSYYSTEMKWSKKNQDNANENEESSAWHRNRKARREREKSKKKVPLAAFGRVMTFSLSSLCFWFFLSPSPFYVVVVLNLSVENPSLEMLLSSIQNENINMRETIGKILIFSSI